MTALIIGGLILAAAAGFLFHEIRHGQALQRALDDHDALEALIAATRDDPGQNLAWPPGPADDIDIWMRIWETRQEDR